MKFLELIKSKEADYVGLGQFLSYLETASIDDLYVDATHSDSVKVLTIHKSKGLEFAVVILPFLRIDIILGLGEILYLRKKEILLSLHLKEADILMKLKI